MLEFGSSDAGHQLDAGVYINLRQHELSRFKKLSALTYFDTRNFDLDLVNSILSLESLASLEIDKNCRISFDLIKHLLSGLKDRRSIQRFMLQLDVEMEVGGIGLTCKSGAKPIMKDGILVPADDWKKPIWTSISAREGLELMELAKQMKVDFRGTIPEAIRVEKAFKKETTWLDAPNYYLKTGKFKEE